MAILRKLPAAVAVAALTVTLVGCGTSQVRDERDEARMERDQTQAELDQTQTERDQAQAHLEAAQEELEAAQAEAAAAEQARMDAEAEAAAAAAAAEQARMDAEEETAAAEQARMDEEAARMTAEEDQQAAEDALADAEAAAAAAAAMAASDTAKVLLGVLMNGDVNRETPTDPTSDPVHTVPTPGVSVSSEGMLMASAPNVRGYTAGMAPDMIEGWRGATLSNSEGDTLVVYSDIGNDGTKTLLDRYTSALPTATAPRTWTIQAPDGTVADLISWSAVRRMNDDSTFSGAPGEAMLTFMGTVHNIPGTFSCMAAAIDTCSAPARFSDNTVDGTTGDNGPDGVWTFVPNPDADTYTDDTSYHVFGWWLSKGADGEPDDLVLISPAATGLGMARTETSTEGDNLRGSATYSGAAAGKYAMAHADTDTYEGGHFTATASLSADFDGDSTPEATPNAAANDRLGIDLSGTIDNFMTGDVSRPNWMVTLTADGNATMDGAQAVNDLGTAIANTDTQTPLTTEWSTGGAQRGTGEWQVTFYGGDNDLATNTAIPGAAEGTFNAHIGTADADAGAIGRIQGSFAVNIDDE